MTKIEREVNEFFSITPPDVDDNTEVDDMLDTFERTSFTEDERILINKQLKK